MRSALEEHGYRLVAERRCRFMSGIQIQRADLLAEVALAASHQRDGLMEANHRNEPAGMAGWRQWYEVTQTAGAAASAADMMTAAAIEAFVNEVLANRFRELFDQLEVREHKPPRVKLRRLCEELEIPFDADCLAELAVGFDRRRASVHFRPECVDDETLIASPLTSMALPVQARAFVDAASEVIAMVLAATGSPVPATHMPWRQAALLAGALLSTKGDRSDP